MKHSQARIFLVYADPVIVSKILEFASESVVGGQGFVWILSEEDTYMYGETAKNSNAKKHYSRFFGGLIQNGGLGFIENDILIRNNFPSKNIEIGLKQIA